MSILHKFIRLSHVRHGEGYAVSRCAIIYAHLRRDIFLCKSSTTTCNNQIQRVFRVRPLRNEALYVEHIVRNYARLISAPLIATRLCEDFLQGRNDGISRRVFGRCFRDDNNASSER